MRVCSARQVMFVYNLNASNMAAHRRLSSICEVSSLYKMFSGVPRCMDIKRQKQKKNEITSNDMVRGRERCEWK